MNELSLLYKRVPSTPATVKHVIQEPIPNAFVAFLLHLLSCANNAHVIYKAACVVT
jgi:hypothetical protein